ncbi:Winged helix-turn-helix transcription repressor DNA-binding [Raphanus sativus]|uniref:Heat stress transcription factor A-5-like n=1 Tax=Raphanus sativus TaxID=3726 RepID=A0A6J0N6C7_RAPSA|nr:heat stress transcription factor A-5-like [Raphanus sativus]KAJ4902443.1 Winged helix-turn-helix transcription repressor DNA-binding [Raphanus sativus]
MVCKLPAGSSSSFYLQLYQIVDDRSSDQIISWSKTNNNSFVVWDLKRLRRDILLKSSSVLLGKNLPKFMAKLRSHGFKTVFKGPGELEFSHDDFTRDPLMKKMMAKALAEKIERFDAQIKTLKCRLKAKKASIKVETLFQNLCI